MESLATIENRTNGNYMFCAKYSPHLKPIERAFVLIKKIIRENKTALSNPVFY